MFVDHKGLERWRCWSDGHAGTAIDAVMIGHNLDVTGAALAQRAGHLPASSHPTAHPHHGRGRSRRCTPGRTTVNIACGAPKARTHAPGSTTAASTTTSSRPTGSGSTPIPRRARPRGLPAGEASPSARSTARALAYVQVRNLDGQAPASTATRPHNTALPAVTFPRGAPASGPVVVSEGVLDGLIVAQAGYRSAALISTSSIASATSSPADQIRAHAHGEPIVLALDGDPARAATARLAANSPTPRCVLHILDHEDLTSLHAPGRTSHG